MDTSLDNIGSALGSKVLLCVEMGSGMGMAMEKQKWNWTQNFNQCQVIQLTTNMEECSHVASLTHPSIVHNDNRRSHCLYREGREREMGCSTWQHVLTALHTCMQGCFFSSPFQRLCTLNNTVYSNKWVYWIVCHWFSFSLSLSPFLSVRLSLLCVYQELYIFCWPMTVLIACF